MSALVPSSLIAGKYRLERPLGRGGMGEVWIAQNLVLGKRVALKVIADDAATCPVIVERFLREAVSASRVRHPAIVEVHDAGTDAGIPWIAMELLSGESLAERIRRRVLSVAEAMELLLPIVDALAALHEAGIVHRDLKPDNIFLESAGDGTTRAKLLDFGIAKSAAISPLTKTGELIGTGHYLSPEQARGARDVDARSDLFSMGVVFFESLSGRTPYEAETLPELIAKLFTEPPRSLTRLAPSVPAVVARIVHRCLEREPAARPHDARELSSRLRAAYALSIADGSSGSPDRAAPLAATLAMPPQASPDRAHVPRRWVGPAIVLAAAPVVALALVASASLAHELGQARALPPASSVVAPTIVSAEPVASHVAAPSRRPTTVNATAAPLPHEPVVTTIDLPTPRTVARQAVPVAEEDLLLARVEVRSGEAEVSGQLSRTEVRRAFRRLESRFVACGESARTLYHPSVTGRITVEFDVGANGSATDVAITSSTVADNGTLGECVVRAVETLRFGLRDGTPHARYPLVFVLGSPRARAGASSRRR